MEILADTYQNIFRGKGGLEARTVKLTAILFKITFSIILLLNQFSRSVYDVIIGGLFLRSLVLCFKPTSD